MVLVTAGALAGRPRTMYSAERLLGIWFGGTPRSSRERRAAEIVGDVPDGLGGGEWGGFDARV